MRNGDGITHSLPKPIGDAGVLAALLRTIPLVFAPTDRVELITPFGEVEPPGVSERPASKPVLDRAGGPVGRLGQPAHDELPATLQRPHRLLANARSARWWKGASARRHALATQA
jgi:hypothetical protein